MFRHRDTFLKILIVVVAVTMVLSLALPFFLK